MIICFIRRVAVLQADPIRHDRWAYSQPKRTLCPIPRLHAMNLAGDHDAEDDLDVSWWPSERHRLLEDKQVLLDENIQLRRELLQLQQDHIALLQLVSVQQQQLEQRSTRSPESQQQAQTLVRPVSQPNGQQSARMLQQQYMVRPTSSMRHSSNRDSSNASLVQLSRSSTPQSSRKPRLHSALQRSIQSLLTPGKSRSKTLSASLSADTSYRTDGNNSSNHALRNSSNRAVIDVAALTGLTSSCHVSGGPLQQQQWLPALDSVSSSMQYYRSSSPTGINETSAGPFCRIQHSSSKQWRMQPEAYRSSSSRYRSSSPGLIVGSSTAADNNSRRPGGWRVNRPSPLTTLQTAPAAAAGLPPHPGASRCHHSSRYSQQQQEQGRHQQQQQQLVAAGSEASEVFELHSCPANVCVDPPWSVTPTATRYNSSSMDSSTPSSASSSRDTEVRDNSSSFRSSQALGPAASSSSIAGTSIADSDCGCDNAPSAAAAAAGGGVLTREDTARLLTRISGSGYSAAGNDSSNSSSKSLLAGRSISDRHVISSSSSRYAGCGSGVTLKVVQDSRGGCCNGEVVSGSATSCKPLRLDPQMGS